MVSEYYKDIEVEFDKRFSNDPAKGIGLHLNCSAICRRLPLHQVTQAETRIIAKILRARGFTTKRGKKGYIYYVRLM